MSPPGNVGENNPMSLDLDFRQRAMLQEMGVRVWRPPSEVEAAPVASLPTAASAHERNAAVPHRAAPAPRVEVQTPAGVAIENLAGNAVDIRARDLKDIKNPVREKASALPGVLAEGIAAMDGPTLAQTITTCQACKLCTGRRAPVLGGLEAASAAPQQADWLVVGEPPDEAEERAGTPFVDLAGQLLDNMLKAVGARRLDAEARGPAAAYVTHVVKCRPALARNPAPQELALCENYLRREVALVQPKVILALGRFAAQSLLQGTVPGVARIPLGKLRGQIYRYQGIPVIVSYHPNYLLRTQQDKARAWVDLCLALQTVRGEA